MEEFYEFEKLLEKHDKHLKMIYSLSKEGEYAKKFKYNNKTKFRIKYDPADFKKLKKNKIEYYNNEQIKLEQDKKRVEDLIDAALNAGIFNDTEIKMLENNKNDTELMEELVNDLGEESRELIKEAIKITGNGKVSKITSRCYISDSDSNYDSNSDTEKKTTKKRKSDKESKTDIIKVMSNSVDKSKYESRNKSDKNNIKIEETKISNQIKSDKYRSRQKNTLV
jgi:hypothetical protein